MTAENLRWIPDKECREWRRKNQDGFQALPPAHVSMGLSLINEFDILHS